MRKTFNVYSYKLMRYLEDNGFRFIGTKVCEEDSKRIIFWFEDSEELRTCVKRYTDGWIRKFNSGA